MSANLTVEKRIYWQVFWRGYSVHSAALFHHKSVATRLHDFILNELQQLSVGDHRPLLDQFAYKRRISFIYQLLLDDGSLLRRGAIMSAATTKEQLIAERDDALDGLARAIAERDRQMIAAAVNGPHRRAMHVDQRDAGHLPLFINANEPRLI
jgi:hypothetical protein